MTYKEKKFLLWVRRLRLRAGREVPEVMQTVHDHSRQELSLLIAGAVGFH